MLLVAVQYMRFMSGKSLLQWLSETPDYARYRIRGRRRPAPAALRSLKRGLLRLLRRGAAAVKDRGVHAAPPRAGEAR